MKPPARYRLIAPSACLVLALASVIKDADRMTTWVALAVAALSIVVVNVFYIQLHDRYQRRAAPTP
jgi:hypothetical protein